MSEKYTCEQCGEHTYEQFSQTQVRCMHCGNVSEFDTGYRVTPQFESIAEEKILPVEHKPDYTAASFGKRITNYIIDVIVVTILLNITGYYLQLEIITPKGELTETGILVMLIIIPVYYLLMEYSLGKTMGKIITKTKVISTDGSKPSFLQCMVRALTRLLPMEQFSGLFFNGIFWHDSIPKTLVVDDF